MGLNETIDRLIREREEREAAREAGADADKKKKIIELTEQIFFQRMLKDINPGMGEPKIDAMIDRSVMIATKLYNKLYE